jgi:hypothetical protein
MEMKTFDVLGIPMTMDEAERLLDWINKDAGKSFWRYAVETRQNIYDSFVSKSIEDPVKEVLMTQRQKAALSVFDDLIGLRAEVAEIIKSEKATQKELDNVSQE